MTHTPTTAGPPRDTAPDRRPGGSPPYGPGRPGPPPKPPLRPDIQGLRGLAVTLVVLAHAGVPYVAGGYAGVDVFFVISGFLITSGLLREADRSGSLSLRRFYARRALRILPLATLVSLATIAGCRLFASKIRYAEFMHDALAGALYFVNVGDSHAAQWFPALERLSRRYGWKLVSLTKSSCKTADITTVNGHGPYTSCDTWRKDALARIARLRPMLVVASSSEVATPLKPMKDPRRDWTAGYARVYDRLARAADHVAVLLDTPWPNGDPVECAATHPLRLEKCEPDQRDAIKDPALREANRQGAQRAGATVIDPEPWLCPRSGRCPVVVGDTFVYRDESHMAETYAGALAPVLGQELRKLGLVGR